MHWIVVLLSMNCSLSWLLQFLELQRRQRSELNTRLWSWGEIILLQWCLSRFCSDIILRCSWRCKLKCCSSHHLSLGNCLWLPRDRRKRRQHISSQLRSADTRCLFVQHFLLHFSSPLLNQLVWHSLHPRCDLIPTTNCKWRRCSAASSRQRSEGWNVRGRTSPWWCLQSAWQRCRWVYHLRCWQRGFYLPCYNRPSRLQQRTAAIRSLSVSLSGRANVMRKTTASTNSLTYQAEDSSSPSRRRHRCF